ncbi:MAG: hypothetical protein E7456_02780 [Ruminococcaceae bacterium]|nr:hypothetical protein [Oscillospiraceae bacterium]
MKRSEALLHRSMIEKSVQSLDSSDALKVIALYPSFDSMIGQTVEKGFRFSYGDKLWSVVQPELTIQAQYPPGVGTESLYEEVCETHLGTLEDPIPYSGNMALESGRYYIQDGVIYLCTRDTVNPVYNALSELVGTYTELI